MLRTVSAVRYVTLLREGGSLPALVEADDDGLYVVKMRGAGQGPEALVAELVAAELARELGLPVPEPSPVHAGLCDDPSAMLEHLRATLVAPPGKLGGRALAQPDAGM